MLLQSHSGVHTHTHIHRHTQITSHQYGRGQAILWEVTLQMSRQLQGHRTYFFPAGAFLMGCRGRQKHTGGRDKTAEQHIRIGIDNKPIIHDGRELTNTTRGRSMPEDIGVSVQKLQVKEDSCDLLWETV